VQRRETGTAPVSVQSSTEASTTASSWADFPEFPNNKTLTEHAILTTNEDHHQYYNSSFVISAETTEKEWVNMSDRKDVQVNTMLSDSHRRAAVRILSEHLLLLKFVAET
jgi:hypothetical protein